MNVHAPSSASEGLQLELRILQRAAELHSTFPIRSESVIASQVFRKYISGNSGINNCSLYLSRQFGFIFVFLLSRLRALVYTAAFRFVFRRRQAGMGAGVVARIPPIRSDSEWFIRCFGGDWRYNESYDSRRGPDMLNWFSLRRYQNRQKGTKIY